MKTQLKLQYEDMVSMENLLAAWQEFARGKKNKPDVQKFSRNLAENILSLHTELSEKIYRHGGYHCFKISDPKPRNISKAQVRDRLVHHAIYRILYPFFDKIFIADSYSCRVNKGTHKAIARFQKMFYQVSRNNTRTCWVLKLDIRKFFASIDHQILKKILQDYIPDKDILWLLEEIIDSFGIDCFARPTERPQSFGQVGHKANSQELASSQIRSVPNVSASERVSKESTLARAWQSNQRIGLPLGNLTSQLFVNIYMNEFDQFVKHRLKAKYYIRYADDFVILSNNKKELVNQLITIQTFLNQELKLSLHPNKTIIKTYGSGVDFLGWVNFVHHKVLRTATKRRMIRRIKDHTTAETVQSYLGLLKHGNTYKIEKDLLNDYWIFRDW